MPSHTTQASRFSDLPFAERLETAERLAKSDPMYFWEALTDHAQSEALKDAVYNPPVSDAEIGRMVRAMVVDYCSARAQEDLDAEAQLDDIDEMQQARVPVERRHYL